MSTDTLLNVVIAAGLVCLGWLAWQNLGHCDRRSGGFPHPKWDCCLNWRRYGTKR